MCESRRTIEEAVIPVTRPVLGALAVALVAAAAPGAASAATVSFDRQCYAPGDPITQTGAGFTPGAQVSESLAGVFGATPLGTRTGPPVAADANGAFTRTLTAPPIFRTFDRQETAVDTFTDQAAPASPVVARWTLSQWAVVIPEWRGRTADPSRSMTVDSFGWTIASGTLYAHYFRGTTRVKSRAIGPLTGPCGNIRKRIRQFPIQHVKAGEWSVFFSNTPVLHKASDPWLRARIVVPAGKAT